MGFKPLLLPLLGQTILFACGALVWLAVRHGLYASALLALLTAMAVAALSLRDLTRADRPLIRPPAAASGAAFRRWRLRTLLDQAPSPLLLQSESGMLIALNRAARQMGDDLTVLAEALTGQGGRLAWQGRHYAVSASRLDDGSRRATLFALSDISAEMRASEATALRDLMKILNHELMNALTPVASMSRSALDIMQERDPTTQERAITALQRVVARTEGLIDFIETYRELARLPPPHLANVALLDYCEEVAHSFALQWPAIHFTLIPCDRQLLVRIDREQIRLCLVNLLNNAAESAILRPDPRVTLRLNAQQDEIALTIEDNGAGIASDLSEQIFLPFYTTKPQGSGIGLSLTRQILHGHGIEIGILPTEHRPSDALSGANLQFSLKITTE
jgi:signal transduction histidine kinase